MIPPPEKPRLSPRAHGVLADRLYDHLVALVSRGEACPPTHVLAAALDCNIGSIPGLFSKLKARGLVRVEDRSAAMGGGKVNRFRLVTIVATGQCSALRKPPRQRDGHAARDGGEGAAGELADRDSARLSRGGGTL